MSDIPDVVRIDDLLKHMAISRTTLHRWRAAGTFPIRERSDGGRRPSFVGDDLRRWLAGQATSRQLRRVG